MRFQIDLDARLVAQLDRRIGRGRRSAFIAEAVRRALRDDRRWSDILAALGTLRDTEHDWDVDPAAWVRTQRRGHRRGLR